MSEKIAWALTIAGIAGVAVLAYVLLTRRAYGAAPPTYPYPQYPPTQPTPPQPPTQPSPPQQPQPTPPITIPPSPPQANVEILDYEVY
jgi:hypothetical protein